MQYLNNPVSGWQAVGVYYHRYAEAPVNRRCVPGLVDGRPAILMLNPNDSDDQPAFFILLDWADGKVAGIRDFMFAARAQGQASAWQHCRSARDQKSCASRDRSETVANSGSTVPSENLTSRRPMNSMRVAGTRSPEPEILAAWVLPGFAFSSPFVDHLTAQARHPCMQSRAPGLVRPSLSARLRSVRFCDHPADGFLQPLGKCLAVRAHVRRHGFSPRQCHVNPAEGGDLQ